MTSWGYIAVGVGSAVIAAFFLVFVIGHGSDALGVLLGIGFTVAAAVFLPIGVIAEGVRIGSREARTDRVLADEKAYSA